MSVVACKAQDAAIAEADDDPAVAVDRYGSACNSGVLNQSRAGSMNPK